MNCSPSPCELAFPDSDYYGNCVAIPNIQRSTPYSPRAFRVRQSTFSLLEIAFCAVGWDFRHLPHIVVGSFWIPCRYAWLARTHQNVSVTTSISLSSLIAPTSDYPRQYHGCISPWFCTLRQFSFHPHAQIFILTFSRGLEIAPTYAFITTVALLIVVVNMLLSPYGFPPGKLLMIGCGFNRLVFVPTAC